MAEKNHGMSFSDDESENVGTSSSLIAHKSMPEDTPSPDASDKGNENKDQAIPENNEPVSPENEANDVKTNVDETVSSLKNSFEAISDDEDSNVKQNKNSESQNTTVDKVELPVNESDESANKTIEEKKDEANSPKDVDAPIPSPFSDIGDAENIIGTGTDDNELISDIMKDSKEADFDIASTKQEDSEALSTDITLTTTVESPSTGETAQFSETPISEELLGVSEEIATEEVATEEVATEEVTTTVSEDAGKSQGRPLYKSLEHNYIPESFGVSIF